MAGPPPPREELADADLAECLLFVLSSRRSRGLPCATAADLLTDVSEQVPLGCDGGVALRASAAALIAAAARRWVQRSRRTRLCGASEL